jgi:hypothetical protein
LLAEGEALMAAIAPIEGRLMQVNIKGSEGNLNFPDMLNEQLYSFANLLEHADTAPTKQENEFYAALHAQLQTELDAWASEQRTHLSSFHEHPQHAGH